MPDTNTKQLRDQAIALRAAVHKCVATQCWRNLQYYSREYYLVRKLWRLAKHAN